MVSFLLISTSKSHIQFSSPPCVPQALRFSFSLIWSYEYYSRIPWIAKLTLWKSWYFGNWGLYSQVWKSSKTVSTLIIVISPDLVSYYIRFFRYEDLRSMSPGLSASLVETEHSRTHRRGLWCPWTSSWGRNPNAILLWLVVQPKYITVTKNDL